VGAHVDLVQPIANDINHLQMLVEARWSSFSTSLITRNLGITQRFRAMFGSTLPKSLDKVGVDLPRHEIGVGEDLLMQRDRRWIPGSLQGADHAQHDIPRFATRIFLTWADDGWHPESAICGGKQPPRSLPSCPTKRLHRVLMTGKEHAVHFERVCQHEDIRYLPGLQAADTVSYTDTLRGSQAGHTDHLG
jgi:hypothetical protein